MNGWQGTGPNGNTIFLPAAGCRWDKPFYRSGSHGVYWSRTLYGDCTDIAFYLKSSPGSIECINGYFRTAEFTVRAVRVSEN